MNQKADIKKRATRSKKEILPELVAAAVEKCNGSIEDAAIDLNCTRNTITRIINKNPLLKEAIVKIREEIVDEAEISLLKRIREGNITSIIFALKTLGKSRGYSSTGKSVPGWAKSLTKTDLKKLSDDELVKLEKLLKKGKDPSDFLIERGINASSD